MKRGVNELEAMIAELLRTAQGTTNKRFRFIIILNKICQSKENTHKSDYMPLEPELLCLTASNSKMAVDTETFKESRRPNIGMRICASAAVRHVDDSPVDSVPMTIAVPQRMSVS